MSVCSFLTRNTNTNSQQQPPTNSTVQQQQQQQQTNTTSCSVSSQITSSIPQQLHQVSLIASSQTNPNFNLTNSNNILIQNTDNSNIRLNR